MGKEFLHLHIQLVGQRLVMTEDEGGAVPVGDDIGHREGLTRTRHAEQHLGLVASLKSFRQLSDGLGLVACRLVVGNQLIFAHGLQRYEKSDEWPNNILKKADVVTEGA